ncbi:MAG: thioredoxin family protein [Planctomycetota bacterium]
MALTESTMLKTGTAAPDFSLPATDGSIVSRSDFVDRPLLVMFICNHCPYVVHVAPELAKLGIDYADTALAVVAIQSNDVEAYPDDGPEKMKEEVTERGYGFPYLYDETQQVARAYTAACTPDFFLFDKKHQLVYRGRLDETRPRRIESGVYDSADGAAHGAELRAAIDNVLAGNPQGSATQYPSLGCNIKWKAGNEPEYFNAG